MPRESLAHRRERAAEIIARLRDRYPAPRTALDWDTPLELLVATILSAQSTDKQINEVTPALFSAYETARDYAEADRGELEQMIHSTGFFRNKAKSLQGMGQKLVDDFDGQVPQTMDELVTVPGVARKTANVVLQNAYGVVEGIVVDTHVKRVSYRLGLTREQKNMNQLERDLMQVFPREDWAFVSHALIFHGRDTCDARKPRCSACPLEDLCPRRGVQNSA
jgi:endonuclease-3